jgi:hypothetical protein
MVELLVTMAIGMVAFGGLLGVLQVMLRQSSLAEKQSEAQDQARSTMNRLVVSMRNAVAVTGPNPSAVARADPAGYDLVFQSVHPHAAPHAGNRYGAMRVRYCLDRTAPGQPVLRMQTQPDATAAPVPTATACDASGNGWVTNQVVADRLVDDGPVWKYAYDESGNVAAANVRSISMTLSVDADLRDARGKRDLTSGVTLRNANRQPLAALTISRVGGAIVANASGAHDPDGDSLTYRWFVSGTELLGETGVRLRRTGLSTGTQIRVVVTDAGGLTNEAIILVPAS